VLGILKEIAELLQFVVVWPTPPNCNALEPLLEPKLLPFTVTVVPRTPDAGDRLTMFGPLALMVNNCPALDNPPTDTTTFPVAAPVGTVATIRVADQLVGEAAVPLNVRVLAPCVAPKLEPEIDTLVPITPTLGERLETVGETGTVNKLGLLAIPLTVTTTFPVVVPGGTGAEMLFIPQLVAVAKVPLKEIEFVPCEGPKLLPPIVTDVLTGPEDGDKLEMVGPDNIVNELPLLAIPPAVIITFPVVAPVGTVTIIPVELQLLAVADVPLKVTVLLPCVAPKLVPVIRTVLPTTPEAGDKLVMPGVCKTVNAAKLLFSPFTCTITLPVIAPVGTENTICDEDQLDGVPVVPLIATELEPCEEPKLLPAIVSELPITPEMGVKLVMLGGTKTVKFTPLLFTPLA